MDEALLLESTPLRPVWCIVMIMAVAMAMASWRVGAEILGDTGSSWVGGEGA